MNKSIIVHRVLEIVLVIGAALVLWSLTSCASWSPERRAQTIAALEQHAVRFLGRMATATLQNIAQGDGDYAHAAATAVWQSVDIGDIARVVRDAGASPELARKAEDIAVDAMHYRPVKAEVISAVAGAISSAALRGDIRGTPIR